MLIAYTDGHLSVTVWMRPYRYVEQHFYTGVLQRVLRGALATVQCEQSSVNFCVQRRQRAQPASPPPHTQVLSNWLLYQLVVHRGPASTAFCFTGNSTKRRRCRLSSLSLLYTLKYSIASVQPFSCCLCSSWLCSPNVWQRSAPWEDSHLITGYKVTMCSVRDQCGRRDWGTAS